MTINYHRVSGLVGSVILAIALCGNAAPSQTDPQTRPQAGTASEHSPGKRLIFEGVGNFGEVTPMLYRGGQPSREGFEALSKMGVNIVIDGRLSGHDKERKLVNEVGMQFVEMPWHCFFPRDKTFASFLAVIRENPGKKVFVHCRYGDDRTGMMIAAYRMAVEGWTPEDARREMDAFGYKPLVCPRLGPYEKKFPEHLKKNSAFQSLQTGAEPADKN
jgi:protein tyrosine phosphatase (PTP) superfamily phosphohydrolase (DUF442 family)